MEHRTQCPLLSPLRATAESTGSPLGKPAVDQARLRHRRRRLVPRQGAHRLQPGPPAPLSRAAGHDAEARPLPQRRPRDDEPVPARRGLRHQRRRRDRPRHRALRALPRHRPRPDRQRHHRSGLLERDRQGAPRRLPRRHRPGHPAHHQRDQGPGPRHGRATTSTSSSPRSAAPSATSSRCRSSRPRARSATTSAATTSSSCTSRWCRASVRPGSSRPSPPSTRWPRCARSVSSPTPSSAAPTVRSRRR